MSKITPPAPPATLGEVARIAGVSRATACYVLRNQPGPSKKTRDRVLEVATRLKYAPDARIGAWMAKVRGAKAREVLPIAWLNTQPQKDAWHKYNFLSPFLEGLSERCSQLGFSAEEIWTQEPGMTMRRLSQILYNRGIEGVVVTPPAAHIRLKWENLAGVALGTELLAPRLHRIRGDFIFNVELALKMVLRFGYRRVGICISDEIDRSTNNLVSALASHLNSKGPASRVIPPLFHINGPGDPVPRRDIMAWVRSTKPDVILGHDNRLLRWLKHEGLRVPQDIGIVHLAIDDDVLDWAGIHSNRREIGRTAAQLVISLINSRQFGVPKVALDTTIRGSWQSGRTLLIPKPPGA